jgi:hypothetical protein
MLGGSGLALLIVALVAAVLRFRWLVVIIIAAIGILAIVVSLYRSNKFDEYVAATSLVLLRGGAREDSAG